MAHSLDPACGKTGFLPQAVDLESVSTLAACPPDSCNSVSHHEVP